MAMSVLGHVVVFALLNAAVSAAVVLAPGATVMSSGSPNAGGTVVEDITTAFSGPLGLFRGSMRSLVVRAPEGTFDFYFQLTNTTPSPAEFLDGITIRDFTGFTTDVDWITNGLVGIAGAGAFQTGSTPAESVARDATPADDVTFFFPLGSQSSAPAQNPSNFLLIRTNATHYGSGSARVSGAGFTAPLATFAPSVIPEPSTLLFGAAVGFVVAVRRARR